MTGYNKWCPRGHPNRVWVVNQESQELWTPWECPQCQYDMRRDYLMKKRELGRLGRRQNEAILRMLKKLNENVG